MTRKGHFEINLPLQSAYLPHLVNIFKECPLSRHLVSISESRWDSPPEGYSSIIEQRNEQNARDRPPEEIPLPEPQVRGLELPKVSDEEQEQRNVKLVQKKLLEEKMEKLVGQNKKVAGPQAFPSSTTMEYRKQQALPLQKQKKATGANSIAIPPPSSVTQFGNKIEGPVARGQPFGAWQTIEKRYILTM